MWNTKGIEKETGLGGVLTDVVQRGVMTQIILL